MGFPIYFIHEKIHQSIHNHFTSRFQNYPNLNYLFFPSHLPHSRPDLLLNLKGRFFISDFEILPRHQTNLMMNSAKHFFCKFVYNHKYLSQNFGNLLRLWDYYFFWLQNLVVYTLWLFYYFLIWKSLAQDQCFISQKVRWIFIHTRLLYSKLSILSSFSFYTE